MQNDLTVDIVIMTVLPEEYNAICSQISSMTSLKGTLSFPDMYAWKLGELFCDRYNRAYRVAVGIMGRKGTIEGAIATINAIDYWHPNYFFFTGIAGGFPDKMKKDLKIGDVIIADTIYGYEYGKLEKKFMPRNNWSYKTDLGLLNGAVAYSLDPKWLEKVINTPNGKCEAKVHCGEVASGDKVVDNPNNEFFTNVLKNWPSIRAVEMEGAGVGTAIENAQAKKESVGFMMIRGISDIPRGLFESGKKDAQKDGEKGTQERDMWKPFAAATAAAFTIGYIENGLPIPPTPREIEAFEYSKGIAEIPENIVSIHPNSEEIVDIMEENEYKILHNDEFRSLEEVGNLIPNNELNLVSLNTYLKLTNIDIKWMNISNLVISELIKNCIPSHITMDVSVAKYVGTGRSVICVAYSVGIKTINELNEVLNEANIFGREILFQVYSGYFEKVLYEMSWGYVGRFFNSYDNLAILILYARKDVLKSHPERLEQIKCIPEDIFSSIRKIIENR